MIRDWVVWASITPSAPPPHTSTQTTQRLVDLAASRLRLSASWSEVSSAIKPDLPFRADTLLSVHAVYHDVPYHRPPHHGNQYTTALFSMTSGDARPDAAAAAAAAEAAEMGYVELGGQVGSREAPVPVSGC